MVKNLFENNGAQFSECRQYRYALWRIWDDQKPLVMFIGLNPSTADEAEDDNTIKRVKAIANFNGFGGVYMMNCFPFVSTDPTRLIACSHCIENEEWLKNTAAKCAEVVFAWGNFQVVQKLGVDYLLSRLFPNAKALHINKNGSPKHPLFCRIQSPLIPFAK